MILIIFAVFQGIIKTIKGIKIINMKIRLIISYFHYLAVFQGIIKIIKITKITNRKIHFNYFCKRVSS